MIFKKHNVAPPIRRQTPMGGAGNFIKKAIKKPGALHDDLGVPEDEPIPQEKIETAAKGKGKTAQRARFALTLKGLNKKK